MGQEDAALPRETDVLVVGGGATGLGVALDLSLRGVRCVLVEQGNFCGGTSGRHHGELHSGARYAIVDPEAAAECIEENRVLRRIAKAPLEDTGGTFVLLPQDDPSYADTWISACRAVDIPVREIPPRELAAREPNLAPGIRAAFHVPDGGLMALPLGRCLARTARLHGAVLKDWHRLEGLQVKNGRVTGGRITDLRGGGTREVHARVVLNAGGAWGAVVAGMAGIKVDVTYNKGTMVAFSGRLVSSIVQRLRIPSDFDSIIPRGSFTVAGTTGLPTADPGDRSVQEWEPLKIREQTSLLLPPLAGMMHAHAWAAVRPLYDPETASRGGSSRTISRRFSVIDHAVSDGVEGLVTVVGGKLTTYRLMAQKACDAACRKLEVAAPCSTASTFIG
jgi:glycerol-3-phosphate dehydrogenase